MALSSTKKFVWTQPRRECLRLRLAGIPKVQIGMRLGVHRNTINQWCDHPDFEAELARKRAARELTTTLRRARTIGLNLEMIEPRLLEAVAQLEANPTPTALKEFRRLRREYRKRSG